MKLSQAHLFYLLLAALLLSSLGLTVREGLDTRPVPPPKTPPGADGWGGVDPTKPKGGKVPAGALPGPDGAAAQGIPKDQYYLLKDLWEDTSSGHNLVKTVFVECGQGYYDKGPEALKPVGETEFVVGVAKESISDPSKAQISAIVSHANMMLGDSVGEVLEAHIDKGEGLFKGIRHAGGWDDSEEVRNSHSNPIRHISVSYTHLTLPTKA